MATKSVKKPATKKVVAKKAAAKPVATKKAAVKKPAPIAPVVEHAPCGCAGGCQCHKHCHCGKAKKLIAVLVFFALGFIAATVIAPKHPKHMKMPQPTFENGCLVVECPKLAEMVPAMDTNADNCVSIEEFKAHKRLNRHGPRGDKPVKPAPSPDQVTE